MEWRRIGLPTMNVSDRVVKISDSETDKELVERIFWTAKADIKAEEGLLYIDRHILVLLENPEATIRDLGVAIHEYAKSLDYDVNLTVELSYNSYFQDDAIKISWCPA